MAYVVQPRTVAVEPTDGEAALRDFLSRELDDNWTVYVQPFLNGDEPDLVALNPRAGVIVFEVKDYAEGAYSAEEGAWRVHDAQGTHRIASPVDQINRYRSNIVGLYCPEIGEEIDQDPRNLATIRLVLYFHRMTGDTARNLCRGAHRNLIVLGSNELSDGTLRKKCTEVRTGESKIMRPQWDQSLTAWLSPPRHLEEHGRLDLTPEQRRHAQPAEGRRRLRGVAGVRQEPCSRSSRCCSRSSGTARLGAHVQHHPRELRARLDASSDAPSSRRSNHHPLSRVLSTGSPQGKSADSPPS